MWGVGCVRACQESETRIDKGFVFGVGYFVGSLKIVKDLLALFENFWGFFFGDFGDF